MKRLIIGVALATCAGTMSAAPLWLRNTAISPDAKTVAFTYKGDIWTVPVSGGTARQLTTSQAYDSAPVWSPDGSKIAFASDREGSLDIYVVNANGGTPRRLTTSSGTEAPRAWLNDSTVLFSANGLPGVESAQLKLGQVYSVTTSGARPRLWQSVPMTTIDVNHADGRVLYQDRKGYEDVLRKHERSSGTADVWMLDNGAFKALTTFNGQDQNPVWMPDGKVAFASEQDGTLNVWTMNADGSDKKQLTTFKDHPVRNLSAAADGTMAFSWNGEIYTMRPGGQPVKLDVVTVADDYDGDHQRSRLSSGARSMAVSPSGEEVVFVLRGDVYATSVKYKTTRRITNTTGQERNVTFAPDGKSIVYDSERDGKWALYKATIDDPEAKLFTYAANIVETPLYSCEGQAQQPDYSPDGKKVAFLEDRTALRVLDLASGKVVTALDPKYNYSYSDGDLSFEWSPDSRWFLTDYIGVGGWNNTDVALVAADGSQVVDLTESGYADGGARWAMGGKALTYATGRYGMKSHGSWGNQNDVVIMFLDGEAWDEFNRTAEEADLAKQAEKDKDKDKAGDKDSKDKKDKKKADKKEADVKPLVFDLDNRQYRTRRITGVSSSMGDHWLSTDGAKLYYVAQNADGSYNLMERDLKKGETKQLVAKLSGGLVPDKKGENLYVIGGGAMSKVKLADGKKENIEFEADYDRHPSAEREYIYDHMVAQVRDKFHDVNLHGTDWDKYAEAYRRFLPHINNNYDFATLLSEILGELNASHTGGSYHAPGARMQTAVLGAFYDDNYDGAGLKVAGVLPRGPLATKKADVQPGDVITAIDGVTITPGMDVNPLLDGKIGRKVRLDVRRAQNGKTESVTVRPISSGTQDALVYQRWVEHNEAVVDSLSNGRIGYVHVQGMNGPSFSEVYSKLLGKYRNREAVVVDTRWNGGGWLHNDIAILLSGKEYVRYTPRGRYIGSDPFSQWTKPSVMLVNEGNYSDAHGTPYVYQTLGIGDIVGAPVPGTMTAVWWETQIDPTLVFGIPEVTSLDRNGEPLENKQLNPDVLIYNNPGDVARGYDAQLAGAVQRLLEQLNKK